MTEISADLFESLVTLMMTHPSGENAGEALPQCGSLLLCRSLQTLQRGCTKRVDL
jgi:hypothetical protein